MQFLLLLAYLLLVEAVKEEQNEYLFQGEHDDADSLEDEDPGPGPGCPIVRDYLSVEDLQVYHNRLD